MGAVGALPWLVLLLLLGLCFSPAGAQSPSVIFHDANTLLTYRAIPSCAFDVHSLLNYSATPGMWQLGGESCSSTLDFSFSGSWDTQSGFVTITPNFTYSYAPNYAGVNPVNRLAGAAALLAGGVLIYGGGKMGTCPNPSYNIRTNDVMYSLNNGYTWSQATAQAAWCARSDFAMAPAPGTKTVVLVGGTCNGAVALNDVWISTDGLGAYWTLQTATGNFAPWTQGSIAFMYDSVPTLVMYSPWDNAIKTSPDLGKTWTAGASLAPLNSDPTIDARLIADVQNNVYLVGGLSGNPQLLWSSSITAASPTLSFLTQVNWSPNISNTVMIDYFTYGCLGFRYLPSSTAPAPGYHRQLILYGGTIQVDNLVDSNYRCFFDTGSVSFPQTTSLQAEIIFPGEVYTLATQTPPASLQPRLITHDAAQLLTPRQYADCAYDVHQAVRKTANFSMWQLGGYDENGNFLNSVDYTPTGSWSNIRVFSQPGYSGVPAGSSAPSGRVGGGVALLSSGTLLYFGGKDYNATTSTNLVYANDVYASTNQGQSFTYSATAGWTARSDFATAVLPMTSTVVIAGGMYSATSAYNGNPFNDVWYSSDGQGAVWNQATAAGPFPPFTDAAFCALYDGSAAGGSQQYSTLLLYIGAYESTQNVYSSTNLGASWTALVAAPWSYRLKSLMVADAEGYVYFTGGTDTGDVWYSWNKGLSWFNLNTPGNGLNNGFGGNNGLLNPSNVYLNLYQYTQITGTTGNCLALRYVANSASPNGFHKQLVLYGGANTVGVANRPSNACVQQTFVNVLYNEIMFPSEYQNAQWTDTLLASSTASSAPSVAFNSPNALFTYRQYPTCAADVHSLVNHPSAPAQFVLGGWDANANVLASYDRYNGSNYASYSYVIMWNSASAQGGQFIPGRGAGGAGFLSNGNLVWFGGKTNQLSSGTVYANDVWYTGTPSWSSNTWPPPQWLQATAKAPWAARSDMSTAVLPGTSCVLLAGGTTATANSNDVWQSCDGAGAVWTLQTLTAPFLPFTDGAMTALYDGSATGGSQSTATVLLFPSTYPSYGQYIYASSDAGMTWAYVSDAPWSTRFTARFTADAESNVYMLGGALPDCWYSSNKGVSWAQMQPLLSSGYSQPFQLASSMYGCNFINYQPGSGPQGFHRQLTVASGFISLYSPSLQIGGALTFGNFSIPQCLCDTVTGVRAIVADLLFPGEAVSSSGSGVGSSSSSSGSTTFSRGATAGIAVGVGVGCCLICCVLLFVTNSARFRSSRARGEADTTSTKPTKFENEPSAVSHQPHGDAGDGAGRRLSTASPRLTVSHCRYISLRHSSLAAVRQSW